MASSVTTVKVFSATMTRDREILGERVTRWIRERSDIRVLSAILTQSSDQRFHCLSIILLCGEARQSYSVGTRATDATSVTEVAA
jgi:hypothetical protein